MRDLRDRVVSHCVTEDIGMLSTAVCFLQFSLLSASLSDSCKFYTVGCSRFPSTISALGVLYDPYTVVQNEDKHTLALA